MLHLAIQNVNNTFDLIFLHFTPFILVYRTLAPSYIANAHSSSCQGSVVNQ